MSLDTIVLKHQGNTRLVVRTDNVVYSPDALPRYKERFQELQKDGRISMKSNFNDLSWECLGKHGYSSNLIVTVGNLELNNIMKCLGIELLERGTIPGTLQGLFKMLQKVLILTDGLSIEMLSEFEDYLYECSDSKMKRIHTIVNYFFTFYPDDVSEDYIDIIDGLSWANSKVRKIPDYKSIHVFDHAINAVILSAERAEDEILKYYPLFLWWKITSVIPLRPSEFLELEFNCCWKDDNGRYWIKLPRNKTKQTSSKHQIQKVDTIETTQDIYEFISHYKSLLSPDFQSAYLISWKAYNHFCTLSEASFAKKKNQEIMRLSSVKYLMDDFYKNKLKNEKVIHLKPGDSRHLAFCNMILQGFNPIAIARMGGHTNLTSQMHYYEHLDTYAESYIFTMSDKLRIAKHINTRSSSGKYEAIKRSRLLVTYSLAEIASFLQIEKGYCIIKHKDCEDFTDCVPECWSCVHHVIDSKKYPEAIKELHTKSDNLGRVIKEQMDLLKNISKNMFYEYSMEKSSPSGNARIKATAEQLQTLMAQKIVLDSHMLDYVMEVDKDADN